MDRNTIVYEEADLWYRTDVSVPVSTEGILDSIQSLLGAVHCCSEHQRIESVEAEGVRDTALLLIGSVGL